MRIACLSDLHLGYSGPGRTVAGRSIRSLDVETAWACACEQIVERSPDLVLIAGDVFDQVTPPVAAVRAFLDGVAQISFAEVVVIGGNHETPKTAGVVCPNELARAAGARVHVVTQASIGRRAGEDYVAVHCYPYEALSGERVVVPEPDAAAAVNVMLIHAAVRSSSRPGALPKMYAGPSAYDVSRAEGFDVVVCGDYHEHAVLAGAGDPDADCNGILRFTTGGPVAFYPGSLERCSSSIWQETKPKGWVLVDTASRTLEFIEVPTRPMRDLDATMYAGFWSGMDDGRFPVAGLNGVLHRLLEHERDFVLDALVRLRVDGLPRSDEALIDWRAVQKLRQHCALFHLDIRWAAADGREFTDRRERARAHSLAGDARLFFADHEPAVRDAALGFLEVV
jgi:DNA repair exonuclease SbcCD nuclease subunit